MYLHGMASVVSLDVIRRNRTSVLLEYEYIYPYTRTTYSILALGGSHYAVNLYFALIDVISFRKSSFIATVSMLNSSHSIACTLTTYHLWMVFYLIGVPRERRWSGHIYEK